MAKILDGRTLSARILSRIKEETSAFSAKTGIQPCLAVVQVGEDPASAVYVRNKHLACEKVGFRSLQCKLPAHVGQQKLLEKINALCGDASVHGVLVQQPLPAGYDYDTDAVQRAVAPEKDVDAFHPYNAGLLFQAVPRFLPCTPAGILALLEAADISLAGKHVVVVGRSNIVGKPMAMLALQKNATVTLCHSKTQNLAAFTRQADVLVSAVGRPQLITAEMVTPGATVIDVAVNRRADGTLTGDVDFAAVEPLAAYITPVPGGVGPMTIAMLMQNTLAAAKLLF
jgi:methylenetetrahydrofolate dehydrogenase (NADP+)/methenyltetrahydrofolate cyclohydrolase